MKLKISLLSALVVTTLWPQTSFAQLYYDTNGATGGTSTSSTQNFTDSVWTTDPTGSIATVGYTPGSDVVFSATDGTNVGTGAQNVTVIGTESANSLTFNSGTVTLFGSGSPNLSIGAGGIAVNSTDGVTTLDSSLGTVTVSADQSWNNDSNQALNVNSGVTGSGTLSFGGSGTGAINLNGVVSGNLNLTATSATSPLYLNSGNTFAGTISANGGTVVVNGGTGSTGNNAFSLSNGGTLFFNTFEGYGSGYTNNITLGTGGGSIGAGLVGGSTDIAYSGVITGGTLNVINGDFLPTGSAPSTITTINVTPAAGSLFDRLLAFQDGIFGNQSLPSVAAVNVSAGGILAFSQNDTLKNVITLADGSALENRNGTINLSNVVMPATGTVTLGSDDSGGGAMHIASGISLTGALAIDVNGSNGGTAVYLDGAISGTSGLTVNSAGNGNSPIVFGGASNYTGPTTINSETTYAVGNTAFGSSNVTLNSTTLNLTGGTLSNTFTSGTGVSSMNLISGSGAQALTGLIELPASGNELLVTNNSISSLTVGDIDAALAGGGGSRAILFDQDNSTGSITLNGTNTSVTGTGPQIQLYFGLNSQNGAANYFIAPSADFSNFQTTNANGSSAINLFAGTMNLENSTFVAGQYVASVGSPDVTHTYNLVGAQTIAATLYDSLKNGGSRPNSNPDDSVSVYGRTIINQNTADQSTWSGTTILDGTNLTLSAVSGGRLSYSGNLSGNSPEGLIVASNGVVVLSSPGGNTYNEEDGAGFLQPGSTVAADLKAGSTTLITNTTGGAFGSSFSTGLDTNFPRSANQYITLNNTVELEGGAVLGGTGIAAQPIVAEAATSTIAAGDPGQAGLSIAPSIGTLHLAGGVTAASGLTLSFKLDGLSNDKLDLGAGAFSLSGPITVDFTDIGSDSVLPGTDYILATGSGAWSDSGATFTFGRPDGLFLQSYSFNTSSDVFEVEFKTAPEPGTWALMGLGLLALIWRVRRKRATA